VVGVRRHLRGRGTDPFEHPVPGPDRHAPAQAEVLDPERALVRFFGKKKSLSRHGAVEKPDD
jgi:hypothetical protein